MLRRIHLFPHCAPQRVKYNVKACAGGLAPNRRLKKIGGDERRSEEAMMPPALLSLPRSSSPSVSPSPLCPGRRSAAVQRHRPSIPSRPAAGPSTFPLRLESSVRPGHWVMRSLVDSTPRHSAWIILCLRLTIENGYYRLVVVVGSRLAKLGIWLCRVAVANPLFHRKLNLIRGIQSTSLPI